MRSKLIAAAAVTAGLSLAAVACSASAPAPPGSAASHVRARHISARHLRAQGPAGLAAAHGPGAASVAGQSATRTGDHPFGPGCAQLPRTGGTGRRRGLERLPVATAMARAPVLSDLTRAIRLAGLTTMLNTAHPLTIFAPDNAAFQDLGAGNLQALLSTRSDLARMLKFQVVAGRVPPAVLARQKVLTTIAGTRLYPARAGLSYYINNAWISCGNLHTANATVYIVNQVVVPST